MNGRQAVFTRSQRSRGALTWNGSVGGKRLGPGRYRLSIAGQDAAGNRSAPVPLASVAIRYLALGRAAGRRRAAAAASRSSCSPTRGRSAGCSTAAGAPRARTPCGSAHRGSPGSTRSTSLRPATRRRRPSSSPARRAAPDDRRLEAGARARAAHRRRRVRLRRDDGAARRGGRRGAVRRLLDRHPVAARGLPPDTLRHEVPPRPPSSASPPSTSPSTTSTSAPSPSTARRSSSC